ncbi:MAG TPA: SpoIIE family protein phosphatase, partial [Bacteroidia bacterium]|nr:SpoIIE family protein phosphatase [Bacteroidia bacterium]
EQNKFEETIQYMNKALALGDTTANKQNLMYIYNNIAIAYIGLKDSLKGLEYQFKALRVEEELDNQAGIARSYSNIGSTYVGLNKPKEALMYHLKAVALDEKLNNLQGLSYSYNGAGGYYEWVKDYENANAYYLKALDVSKQSGFKVGIRDAYGLLSSVNEKRKNFEKALEYHKLSSELKDSILNENNLKQTAELNIRYETEKKSKEILLLTKDQQLKDKSLREQRLIRIALIIGLTLFLLLSFLLYNRYRFKQRANVLLEKQKEEIKQKNVLITDSIDYAKTIQEAILPDDEKLTSLFPDHFILYKPKDIVSGDFYWVGKKEGAVICAVADCTGHGVPGAFMSLLGHNILENSILQSSATMDPGQILTMLNKEIATRFSKNAETTRHGMDIAVISIHPEDKTLQYAGAKNPIYIVRGQELTEIKADKFSTGTVLKDRNPLLFTNHKQSIQKGDMIYLFSDGFPDQKGGAEKKKFFYKPFKELLTSISNLPVDQQKKQLDQTITDWIGSGEQVDDILIMGIRFTG